MEMEGVVQTRRGAGWALMAAGVLYATFHASAILVTDDRYELWWLGLIVHALLVVTLMIGLIGARARFDLDGWAGTAWTTSTVLAFLGVTVSHVLWSAAMIGIALVVVVALHKRIVATVITLGAVGWLYLYAMGVRVGDENGRLITPTESRTAVLALTLMSVGIIALGANVARKHPSREEPFPVWGLHPPGRSFHHHEPK